MLRRRSPGLRLGVQVPASGRRDGNTAGVEKAGGDKKALARGDAANFEGARYRGWWGWDLNILLPLVLCLIPVDIVDQRVNKIVVGGNGRY